MGCIYVTIYMIARLNSICDEIEKEIDNLKIKIFAKRTINSYDFYVKLVVPEVETN